MFNSTIKPGETIVFSFLDSSGKPVEIRQHFKQTGSKEARVAIDAPKVVTIQKRELP